MVEKEGYKEHQINVDSILRSTGLEPIWLFIYKTKRKQHVPVYLKSGHDMEGHYLLAVSGKSKETLFTIIFNVCSTFIQIYIQQIKCDQRVFLM